MSFVPLAIEIISVCCLAAYLLHRYGDWRKQHLAVTIATFVAWYFSLMIVFVLPLDVSNTCYRQCVVDHQYLHTTTQHPENHSTTTSNVTEISHLSIESHTTLPSETSDIVVPDIETLCNKPWSYVPPHILPTLWHVVYWTSQVLTWLILPMMQSYANAGDFTVAGKIKTSLIENAIYYGTYLLIFGVCLIYVAIKPELHLNGSQLKVLAITASNTWGLFLLILLMGYGLVEIPRSCWNAARRGQQLQYTYFKIAKLSSEKTEAEENLEDVLDDVKKAADTIRYNHSFRKFVDTILEKCPESLRNSVKRNKDDYEDFNNPTETPTEKSLVRLHKRVITCTQGFHRTQCQWNQLMDKALLLEDVMINQATSRHTFTHTFGTGYKGWMTWCCTPAVEWYWRCWVRPFALRMLAVLLIIFSVMVVWSECLFFVVQPVLSFFAIFINLATVNYHYLSIEIVCGLTIAYLCVCAYYTIFKVRIFNYYYLASHHQTDENSLIFCGMLLCRLTPPLCLNFLGLIHMDTHVTKANNKEETYYTQIMGHMDVIPFISNGFNIYFPIAIVLLCIATFFHLGSRCLHCLGFEQFVGDDDMTQDFTDEGRELVKREKRRRQRKEEGESRRRTWNDRFGEQHQPPPKPVQEEPVSRKRTSAPYGGKSYRSVPSDDRTELLKQAEPIDYTAESGDPFDEYTRGLSINNGQEAAGRYQAQPIRAASRYSTTGGAPPKDIFDDV